MGLVITVNAWDGVGGLSLVGAEGGQIGEQGAEALHRLVQPNVQSHRAGLHPVEAFSEAL